jgi:Rrf2 family protein
MRLRLTGRTYLALRAMKALGTQENRVAGQMLADSIGKTPLHLHQVMSPLVKARWVRSTPGPQGGYQLLVALADISVLDLIEAVDGPTANNVCVLAPEVCPQDQICPLHHAWLHAREALTKELGQMNLAQAGGASRGAMPVLRVTAGL